jgi:hypothetical protein
VVHVGQRPPPRVIKPIYEANSARDPAMVVQLEQLWLQLPAERKQEITQRLTLMVAQRLSQPSLGKEVGDE